MWHQESNQVMMPPPIKAMMAPMSFCRGVSSSLSLDLDDFISLLAPIKLTISVTKQLSDITYNHIVYKHSIRYYTSKNPKRYANHTTNSP